MMVERLRVLFWKLFRPARYVRHLAEKLEAEHRHTVHGHWEDLRESYNDVPKCRCSECGYVHIGIEVEHCPACGAWMDGGGEDG